MGFKMDSGDGPNGDINITPLIDVVLVLLIIFMVLTPRTIEEMSTNLPTPKPPRDNPPDPPKNPPLVVAAYSNGDLALNLKVMEKRELAEKLRKQLRAREMDKRVVFIDAHPDIEYGTIVSVMDLVRDVGAERVGLARLKEDGPSRPEEGGGEEGGGEEAGG
jgi:biopolymer transport protein ExbD